MARRQEQEDASEEVTEIAPDVLRMQLPISMPGLGHVNCYALLDDDGAAVVDPGLPGQANWRGLTDRLTRAGLRVRDVHSVIVTHSHPDHFGGAERFIKEAGARVIAHRSFGFSSQLGGATHNHSHGSSGSHSDTHSGSHSGPHVEASVEDLTAHDDARDAPRPSADPDPGAARRPGLIAAMRRWNGTTPWGGRSPRPPLRSMLRWSAMQAFGRGWGTPPISDPVDHGDVLRLGRSEWFVLHTPGHTDDHFCLHDPERGLFIAGDHVLPTITPHISGLGGQTDPLKSFFYSLDRVGEISGVKKALPAHGHPFHDLHARAEAIKKHHYERLDRVKEIGRELGPATVEQFSQQLFRKRSWGPMAESETYAHLEHLRHLRDAESREGPDGKLIFETG